MLYYKELMIKLNEKREAKYGNNEKGVYHEILTGHYLLGKKRHLSDPKGRPGETSKEAHDRLEALARKHGGQKAIDDAHKKARAAADDIHKQLKATGHTIKDVHWTSKDGDVKRVTGVGGKQKDDASDIYITTHHKDHGKQFHGVSLKASDRSLNVPASSLGQKSSGRKTVNLGRDHKDSILKKHPELKGKNKEARKDWAEANPEKHNEIKKMNQAALNRVAKMHSRELNAKLRLAKNGKEKHMNDLIGHIRDVIAAKKTPGEIAGKSRFIKHTTYQSKKGEVKHHTSLPGEDHEHIFNSIKKNPHHLSITYTKGGTINFHHKGKRFASQSHKFDTQSDPLSTLKTAGRLA